MYFSVMYNTSSTYSIHNLPIHHSKTKNLFSTW